jgi:hypothetical protein
MAIFQKCGPRTDLGWPWLAMRDFLISLIFKGVSEIFADLMILEV